MKRIIKIKVLKENKLFFNYSFQMDLSNTTTVMEAKALSKKSFPLISGLEFFRESFTLNGKPLSEKRVIPKEGILELILQVRNNYNGRKLTRHYLPDERDHHYPLQLILKKTASKTTLIKLWDDNGWWGDQGDTPQCVGYAWAHWLDDKLSNRKYSHPIIPPEIIYEGAKKLDEWKGEDYDGTSVRGGVKYLKAKGKVAKYYWGSSLEALTIAVQTLGPVVVGTSWYDNMFYPNKLGQISATGDLAGGHAYLINGVDPVAKKFRIKNSWGKDWGLGGHAWISFSDMSKLIRESGEICCPV